ncbi:BatA domain-containing protein [Algoriphagus sp. D3-2-R+10]|uniref:BatA domain-containing protein n=1 Tax=Algoriphagus aurantiacus TaxID=3103948 RepID=UPI002B3DB420|nr:BatA domain-containing protein [Algoriphagus sp. D3-2-R+10]MEB2777938.1 BatA domain-containing protein [Algoriphagus sp. D3-2-R+10]
MQFLQPILLWGLLGISIPILIHLWQGTKGQVIHWAAMHWLSKEESSVAKGFRLENILVLLLRILMLVLLVLLLSQVFIPILNNTPEEHVIHLVQPNEQVVEEFKFELQQALEKGEKVYWSDDKLFPISDLDNLNTDDKVSSIQASLDLIPSYVTALNFYMANSQNGLKSDFFLSPLKPNLYLGRADLATLQKQLISVEGGKMLEVDPSGLVVPSSEENETAASIRLEKEDFGYYLGDVSSSEREFIIASLEAIKDVYGFGFKEKVQMEEANLIFDRQVPVDSNEDKFFFISDDFSFSEQANLLVFSEKLNFEHSELVQTGKLPEVILEMFLEFSGIEKKDVPLSHSQMENRFLVEHPKGEDKKANLNLLLLGLFVLCFGAERYFANKEGL